MPMEMQEGERGLSPRRARAGQGAGSPAAVTVPGLAPPLTSRAQQRELLARLPNFEGRKILFLPPSEFSLDQ